MEQSDFVEKCGISSPFFLIGNEILKFNRIDDVQQGISPDVSVETKHLESRQGWPKSYALDHASTYTFNIPEGSTQARMTSMPPNSQETFLRASIEGSNLIVTIAWWGSAFDLSVVFTFG